ncbi:hypothetical protein KC460_04865 [Candidatus Dependentiae bacterium]|nr:hypothetical protein [Candidatus Dependentiae bacterium]
MDSAKLFCHMVFLMSLFWGCSSFSVIIGSDSAISKESYVVFSSKDSDNKIKRFALMEDGFGLRDNATTCTFSSSLSASGEIALNGGTLYLGRDLFLSNVTTMTSLGDIKAGGCSVELPSAMKRLGGDNGSVSHFDIITLVMNSDITINAPICFSGSSFIEGRHNVLTLGSEGKIIIGVDSDLTIKNLIVKGVDDGKIYCMDDTGVLRLKDAVWFLDNDITFSHGSFVVDSFWDLCGDGSFIYQSGKTSTIAARSILRLDEMITFSYDPDSQNKNLIEFIDDTSVLQLNGSTLHATVTGMTLLKGKLLVKKASSISSEIQGFGSGDEANEGITFGDSEQNNDFLCEIASGATLSLTAGTINYKNIVRDAWVANDFSSILDLKSGTRLNLYETLNFKPGFINVGVGAIIARSTGADLFGSLRPEGRYFSIGL